MADSPLGRQLRSLHGSINMLDANGLVMSESINQLSEMISDLSKRIVRLEDAAVKYGDPTQSALRAESIPRETPAKG